MWLSQNLTFRLRPFLFVSDDVLMRCVASSGHVCSTFIRAVVRLRLLNAFEASPRTPPWQLVSEKISVMAASHPPSWPADNRSSPTELMILGFRSMATSFPMIIRRTLPIPMGRTPGFLSMGVSLLFSSGVIGRGLTCSVQSHLQARAIESKVSDDTWTKDFGHKILLHITV